MRSEIEVEKTLLLLKAIRLISIFGNALREIECDDCAGTSASNIAREALRKAVEVTSSVSSSPAPTVAAAVGYKGTRLCACLENEAIYPNGTCGPRGCYNSGGN